mmetsp:Transcript_5289/g.12740  ORF Transcript_5289/g.12740 Transcript_5289/m.12740 type:complete len:245 (+) Transcript_5289:744-1478(+)
MQLLDSRACLIHGGEANKAIPSAFTSLTILHCLDVSDFAKGFKETTELLVVSVSRQAPDDQSDTLQCLRSNLLSLLGSSLLLHATLRGSHPQAIWGHFVGTFLIIIFSIVVLVRLCQDCLLTNNRFGAVFLRLYLLLGCFCNFCSFCYGSFFISPHVLAMQCRYCLLSRSQVRKVDETITFAPFPLAHDQARLHSTIGAEKLLDLNIIPLYRDVSDIQASLIAILGLLLGISLLERANEDCFTS